MSNLSHPISLLKPEVVNTIRTEAAAAEKQGKLTKKQMNLVYDQEWLKTMTPSAYGGKQWSLPDALQLQEALACADGSLGWLVTLCSGAGWFGGFMDPDFAKELFATDKIYLGGSGAVTGTAEISGDSFVINGKWPYATGANEAGAFTANCVVTQKGSPVKDASGKPQVLSFVFLKSEVNVINEWNAMGMVATASQSFEVKDLKVAKNRSFNFNEKPVISTPLFHYPFQQLAEATLTVNMCGMAFHFMDLAQSIIGESGNNIGDIMDKYDSLLTKFQNSRQKLYYAIDMSWQVCAANKEVSQSVLYKVTVASAACIENIRNCVNTLFPHCGLKAANKDMEINRVWRDLQTAGQHSVLASL